MESIRLKQKILIPFTIVTLLIIAAYIAGVYRDEQQSLDNYLDKTLLDVNRHLKGAINDRVHKLSATIEVIAANPDIRKALTSENRSRLLNLATPLFQQLKTKYNITHFYFHNPQRINILRVHQPFRFGDSINRFTAIEAEKTKTLTSGLELGPLGTFTLRAVLPVWENDKLLGYLELGEEIDQIIQEIKKVFAVDTLVIIDKRYLDDKDWDSGMNMLGRHLEWRRLTDNVIVSQTMDTIPQGLNDILSNPLQKLLNKEEFKIDLNDNNYCGCFLPLKDASNHVLGGLMVLLNMTSQIRHSRIIIAIISGCALIFSAALFLLFYIILGQTEKHLKKLLKGLRESQTRLVNAQQIANVGDWNWDVKRDELHCSKEAAHILGLTLKNRPSHHNELMTYIHPDDKDNFHDFIKKLQDENGTNNIIHRIVRYDGNERIIQHCAKAICNPSGELTNINGTIHDITELKEAEKRTAHMGRILAHSWNEIYTFDADTLKFLEVSDGACKNLGYSMSVLREMTALDINASFTHDQFEAILRPLRLGEQQQLNYQTEYQRKDGTRYPVEVRLQLSTEDQDSVFIAIAQDISERISFIDELKHKALYDDLTNLPNRFLFQDHLERALKVAHREVSPLSVLMIDILRLREINDLLGHKNGDLILKKVAGRLQEGLRASDIIARLASDEFIILMTSVDSNQIHLTANKIQELFEEPLTIGDTTLEVEVAIGVVQYPDHGDTPELLMQHADIAVRMAKTHPGAYVIYNPKDDPFSVRRLKLHGEVRQAIKHEALEVYYQPKVNIQTGQIVSVEALARWPHATEGMIPPVDFIPVIEQSGLIRPFTIWILKQSIQQSKLWQDAGIDVSVAVNLSTRNLLDPTLPEGISKLLKHYKVTPEHLTLEITESAIMSRPEFALNILTNLHNMGLKISIDDFGTGYSSLGYLRQLPVSELKIDRSFVMSMDKNHNDRMIVKAIIELAHNLGLCVVAEGVESHEVMSLLEVLECDTAQGYHFSRPLPADTMTSWLSESSWGIARTASNYW